MDACGRFGKEAARDRHNRKLSFSGMSLAWCYPASMLRARSPCLFPLLRLVWFYVWCRMRHSWICPHEDCGIDHSTRTTNSSDAGFEETISSSKPDTYLGVGKIEYKNLRGTK